MAKSSSSGLNPLSSLSPNHSYKNDDDDEQVRNHIGFANQGWQVHKFGGTSVANADCYRTVVKIVRDMMMEDDNIDDIKTKSLAVVVSAMGGKPKTTDLLLSTVKAAAERNDAKVEEIMSFILEKHSKCLSSLFGGSHDHGSATATTGTTMTRLLDRIQQDMSDIRDILKTVALMKWQAKRISELVSGYGELWSAQILHALLEQQQQQQKQQDADENDTHFVFLDARRVITVDEEAFQDGAVVWDVCQQKLQSVYDEEVAKLKTLSNDTPTPLIHFVMTGYVASNTQGVATTLQRDGSDYSAAIMGKLLQAQRITIWTDVDGVLSADPRRVPLAYVLPEVSYNEAMELAYFGAKVIHPKTMQPAISSTPQIPIYIRNTFHASYRGTRIYTSSTTHTDRDRCVCGFSSIENMALINVEGSGLIGVPGVAKRMFGTLESVGVNVVLISQASSEHSITFATLEGQAEIAKTAIEEEFHKELKMNRISQVDVQAPCSIIAAVGDGMSDTVGVSGRFFSALGDAQINVLAISQGCSERNISAVVATKESTRALRAVHAAFRLSHATVRVAIVGGENELGNSLLKLLHTQRAKLQSQYDVDLQVVAVVGGDSTSTDLVCLKDDDVHRNNASITSAAFHHATAAVSSSSTPLISEDAFSLGAPASTVVGFDDETMGVGTVVKGGVSAVMEKLLSPDVSHHVIFDCTADEGLGKLHPTWLQAGIHVVTANNTGLSGSKELRDSISKAVVQNGKQSAQYLREVTVAGGLPILSTLRNLLNSGDKIRRIDGIFSVSMSFILFRISPPLDAGRLSEWDETTTNGAFRGDLSMSPSSKVGKPVPFSVAVKEAMALGLMEDEPAMDLSNEYTARVLMVLAKELGLTSNTNDGISTQSIIESSSSAATLLDKEHVVFDYSKPIPQEIDDLVASKVEAAASRGCVLRQISSVQLPDRKNQEEKDDDTNTSSSSPISIRVTEVPNSHVFAVTPPSCGCVRFFTQRHRRYPLIVQGPAAGADSTASALLAELLGMMRTKVGPSLLSLQGSALSRAGSSTAFLNK